MTEDRDKIVTLKIRKEAWSWVKAEQERLRQLEGTEPSHAEIFDRAWKAYRSHPRKNSVDETHSPELDLALQGKLSDRELEAWKEVHKLFGRPGGIFTLLTFVRSIIDAGGVHGATATDHGTKKKRA